MIHQGARLGTYAGGESLRHLRQDYRRGKCSPHQSADCVSAFDLAEARQRLVKATYLACDFDVGTIACTNDQASIEHKFHVRRARSLCSSSRNVFANIRGRHDDLTLGNVIIFNKDHF